MAGAIATAFPESGIDLYLGSGGSPEGVLAAAALKCLGGDFQGRLIPEYQIQFDRCVAMGLQNPLKVLTMEDLVGNDDVIFAATGVTNGEFLEGVSYFPNQQAETHSVVMHAQTRTIRYIKTIHYLPNKSRAS